VSDQIKTKLVFFLSYSQLVYDKDMAADNILNKMIVESDGVQLTPKANRFAAVSLCHRLAGVELVSCGGREKWNDGGLSVLCQTAKVVEKATMTR